MKQHISRIYLRSLSSSTSTTSNDQSDLAQLLHQISAHLPTPFLLEADFAKWNTHTHQRFQFDSDFDSGDGKPILSKYKEDNVDSKKLRVESIWKEKDPQYGTDMIYLQWSNGRATCYTPSWIQQQLAQISASLSSNLFNTQNSTPAMRPKIAWNHLQEADLRNDLSLNFESLLHNDVQFMEKSLRILYQYGILLVTNTPFHDGGAAVAAFAASVSGGDSKESSKISLLTQYKSNPDNPEIVLSNGTDGPMRTLYGNVWSTSSEGMPAGGSVADSAYGEESLPLHTDMTYLANPPGLQIFQMIQPAIKGGESIYGDGWGMAERLRKISPDAFHTLCSVERRYHSVDKATGWHLQAIGPLIKAEATGDGIFGQIQQIRHNDLDRLPDLPNESILQQGTEAIEDFYEKLNEAHYRWDQILAEDEFRLEVKLQPGDLVAVVNQRCFHGRKSFTATTNAPRAVGGCYTSQDELDSRFRRAGYI